MSGVAIVDYGINNVRSVRNAVEYCGFDPVVTHDAAEIANASHVILPGVGAFGDAMDTLHALDLVGPLRDVAASGRPLIGVCLGFQLLMRESEEFGAHAGLGLIDGVVRRLAPTTARAKVPQIGWNRIREARPGAWTVTPLEAQANGAYMYFVHSYCVVPADDRLASTTTTYEGETYCSAISRGSIHAFQFHPERSGPAGLEIYRAIARLANTPVPA